MNDAALLIIDVQKGLDEPHFGGSRSNPEAEANIAKLLSQWRHHQRIVIHVQHCSIEPDSPLREGSPGNEIKPEAMPIEGEVLFKKSANSAFIGTDLEAHLRDAGISSLVIVGLTTEHCVSTTTRMAGNLGFNVTLVNDATAANEHNDISGITIDAETIHRVNVASLAGEFCTVVNTEKLL